MIKNLALRTDEQYRFYLSRQIYTDVVGKFTMSTIVTDLWADPSSAAYKRVGYFDKGNKERNINGFRISK